MNEDRIVAEQGGGISFVGHDAVELYRVMHIRAAIKLYAATGIIPTRGVGIKKMLAMAGSYTNRRYPATKHSAALAIADLTVWIETMKSALPVEVK